MLPYQNLSLEDMPGEVWKDIPGWEGYYQVSNMGRAKSVARINIHKDGSTHLIKERIRKQTCSGPGRKYLGFSSYKEGAPRRIYLHKAVASAFIPNPLNKPCVDHIDTNTFDNRVENLRWCTYSENLKNPITSQRMSLSKSGSNCYFYGKKRLHSRPLLCIHPDGTEEIFNSIYDAGLAGHCTRSINYCVSGVYTHHHGCKWKYLPKGHLPKQSEFQEP